MELETLTPDKVEAGSENLPKNGRPRVVVIGAGFGGLSVARQLANSEVDVLVLDRNNYHGFWPLLYQVATAGLEPESIAYPVRAILRQYPNVSFRMTEVKGIDFEKKQIYANGHAMPHTIEYDYLVLAAGSANNYFGNDALAEQTNGLKDINEAVQLRNKALTAFEQAVSDPDPAHRKSLMTFVVIGAGPTGVELAGAFAELIGHVLRKDYPMLDVNEARVILVEAGDRVLATFPTGLQKKATQQLQKMGVELMLGNPVSTIENGVVKLKDGTEIAASTIVWAAGVRGAMLGDTLGVEMARGARVKVQETMQLPTRPEVYVIGDMAYLEGFKTHDGKTVAYPMVAQVAIQQGKISANNILATIRNKALATFHYRDKGSMATIGRRSAVFDAYGIKQSGYIAWLGWLFVHLIYLIGFRNRVIVLTNWAWNYFTYDRGARVITK